MTKQLMMIRIAVVCSMLAAYTASAQTFEEKVKAREPLAPVTAAQNVSGKTISAEVCKIEGMEFLGKSNMSLMKAVESTGDRIHIADETGKVYAFKVKKGESCVLEPDTAFGENGVFATSNKIEYLSSDDAGMLYASTGILRHSQARRAFWTQLSVDTGLFDGQGWYGLVHRRAGPWQVRGSRRDRLPGERAVGVGHPFTV